MLGLGVIIKELGGNADSVDKFTSCINKTIKSLVLENDLLKFTFDDDTNLTLSDEGQSCCEHRYMVTDDNLSDYIGAKLLSAEVKQAENEPDEYGEHEVAFLEVITDKGSFVMKNHNEHNGYYGGFCIRAS